MLTPRSGFIILVLAQLVAFSLGEILGTLQGAVILPLWHALMGSKSLLIVNGINFGAIIGAILLSVLCLFLGITIFALLVRHGWPWLARTFQLENTNP